MATVNPGPWVDPSQIEEHPWRTNQGIVKFVEFVVPIDEMSPRAFHLYWIKHHSPNVMNMTTFAQFMRKYTTIHCYPESTTVLPSRYNVKLPFVGSAEVWLNRIEEVGDWLRQEVYESIIVPDELRFLSQDGLVEVIVGKEEPLFLREDDPVESQMIKAQLLIPRTAGSSHEEFHSAASEHGKFILSCKALKKCLEKLVVCHRLMDPLPIEGFVANDIEAIFEFWFRDRTALESFFASPEYINHVLPMEDKHFDTGNLRMVIGKVHVVHDEFSFQPSTTQPLPFTLT